MRHYLINQIKRIVGLSLLSFPCLLFAQEKTPEWAYGYPEETIRGIRYFQLSNTIDHIVQYPSLESLRAFGFMLNPDDEETYIAPDGKIFLNSILRYGQRPRIKIIRAGIHPKMHFPTMWAIFICLTL